MVWVRNLLVVVALCVSGIVSGGGGGAVFLVAVVGGGLLDIIDVTCLDLFLWTGDVRLQIVTYKRLSLNTSFWYEKYNTHTNKLHKSALKIKNDHTMYHLPAYDDVRVLAS